MSAVHPDDLLILGNWAERELHPEWPERQVVSVNRPDRIRGRKVRQAYYSDLAARNARWFACMETLEPAIRATSRDELWSRVINVCHWQPEEIDLVSAVEALPEQNASRSRDFGRGYSQAVKDVLALIGAQVAVQVKQEGGIAL